MTTLDLSNPDELRLVLRGAAENAILETLRRWPHWLRVEVERDPADPALYVGVTLVASRDQEPTIREILRRSFAMNFPVEGGSCTLGIPSAPDPKLRRRGFSARRD